MKKQKLVYYGGDGYDYSPENGIYLIKYQSDNEHKEKEFSKLSEARKFYDNLFCEKAFWDMNTIPELLDCHYLD